MLNSISIHESGRRTNLLELRMKKKTALLFVQMDARKCFIICHTPETAQHLGDMKSIYVNLSETKKIPAYKQAMAMQMGRTPHRTETHRISKLVRVLPMPASEHQYFECWEED